MSVARVWMNEWKPKLACIYDIINSLWSMYSGIRITCYFAQYLWPERGSEIFSVILQNLWFLIKLVKVLLIMLMTV